MPGVVVANRPGVLLYDANGNPIATTEDGGDYKIETISKQRNSAGTVVNPATEDTLSTRASETTLLAADGKLLTIDSVLDSIKDTDGVKKITDALPVGDNIIGRTKVTDGTSVVEVVDIDGVKHLASGKTNKIDPNNTTVTQLDPLGTNVYAGTATDVSQYASVAISIHSDQDSAFDGMRFEFSQNGTNWDDSYAFNLNASQSSTRRFQFPVTARYFRVHYTNGTEATTEFRVQTVLHRENILTSIHRVEKVVHEDRSAQLTKSVIIAQREGVANSDFYPVKADIAGNLKVTTIGTDVPADPGAFVLEFLRNGANSEDLRVDGSVTPVVFSVGPTITNDIWSTKELLLTFTADDFLFDGLSFGPNPRLINGVKVEIVQDSVTTEIFRIVQNEDFLRVPGRLPLVNNTGPKDVLGAVIAFDGLVLSEEDGDYVKITVQDNLTSVKIKYFTATLFAVRVI